MRAALFSGSGWAVDALVLLGFGASAHDRAGRVRRGVGTRARGGNRQRVLTDPYHRIVPDEAPVDLGALALEMLREPDPRVSAERILDPRYWLDLNPALSIGAVADAASAEETSISDDQVERLRGLAEVRGYLHTPATLSAGLLERLLAAVEVMRAEHLPPAFCFVYDEAWLPWSTPSVARLLTAVLGDGYRLTSRVWCHYVPAVPGAGGWSPHADGPQHKQRLTLWIPLGDVTLDNGCMYVLPRDRLPEGTMLANGDAPALLRAARALPARRGEVLGWDHQLVHWGSYCSDEPGEPRAAMSMEFLAPGGEPHDSELPLIEPGSLPSFRERLYFVSRGAITYSRFEPALLRLEGVMRTVERETLPPGADPSRSPS